MESGVDVVVKRWCARLGFVGMGRVFSSLPFVSVVVTSVSFLLELLDNTVERAGLILMSGMAAERGAELPRTMVSLESPDECWVLIVSVRAMARSRAMAVSLLFLRRALLVAEGGRACGVLHRDGLEYEPFGDVDRASGVSPRSNLCINCLVLTWRPKLNSTRLLAPLPLRLLWDARSFPAMTLALGGGWSIHRLSIGSGDGRLTTGGCRSLTGGARAV